MCSLYHRDSAVVRFNVNWLRRHLQVSPSRIADYHGEGITREDILTRLRSVRKDALRLRHDHDAGLIDGSVAQSSSQPENSYTITASHDSNATIDQDKTIEAKSLIDRQRQVHIQTSATEKKRKHLNCRGSSTPRKRVKRLESSESDSDVQVTASKRYVRSFPEPCEDGTREEIAVIIPVSTIDKSLYSLYVRCSQDEKMAIDPDFDASSCSPAEPGQNDLPTSGAAIRRPGTSTNTRCDVSKSTLPHRSNRSTARLAHFPGQSFPSSYLPICSLSNLL